MRFNLCEQCGAPIVWAIPFSAYEETSYDAQPCDTGNAIMLILENKLTAYPAASGQPRVKKARSIGAPRYRLHGCAE